MNDIAYLPGCHCTQKNNPNIMLYKTSYFTSINLTNTLIKPRFPKLFGSSDTNGDSYRKSIITIFNKKA